MSNKCWCITEWAGSSGVVTPALHFCEKRSNPLIVWNRTREVRGSNPLRSRSFSLDCLELMLWHLEQWSLFTAYCMPGRRSSSHCRSKHWSDKIPFSAFWFLKLGVCLHNASTRFWQIIPHSNTLLLQSPVGWAFPVIQPLFRNYNDVIKPLGIG